jgi:hypothetical protein
MGELSPAAQAVLDAYRDAPLENELTAAAVLRAAAVHLLKEKSWSHGARWSAEELQSIAAELEP